VGSVKSASDGYGRQMHTALQAVAQMHKDVIKLFNDCDGTIGGGRKPVFGNTVTRNLTRSIFTSYWMAEGVYRYWPSEKDPSVIEGLTACFIAPEKMDEPLLLVGRIHYNANDQSGCQEWDLWGAYFERGHDRPIGTVIQSQADGDRIVWSRVIAVPLFSIDSADDAAALMERLRHEAVDPAGA
jgi:hypothetical protein